MKNIDPKILEKIASEALELHRKIASDNKRLLDLKKQISEASVGRNSSYKIPLDKGTVRINRVKESLSYSFDQEGFKKLDNQIKDKFLEEEVVKKDLSYSFDPHIKNLGTITYPVGAFLLHFIFYLFMESWSFLVLEFFFLLSFLIIFL